MSENQLQIEVNKPAGVELSSEVTDALEALAVAMANDSDDVSGFGFDPKSGGAFGGLGGLPKANDQWKICWGGYAKSDTGGDQCASVYYNSESK